MFFDDGTTPIVDGQFITLAQGAAGLKFTPTTNSIAQGSFEAQASTNDSAAGLSGVVVTATITIGAPPASSVITTTPARTSLTSFPVSWTGTPGAAGTPIAFFNIFVSVDGGPFTTWFAGTTATSALFSAEMGHSYGFASQAVDVDGNVEPTHTVPDITIVTTAVPWQNPVDPVDVNDDGSVEPSDALAVINYLNAEGGGSTLPTTAIAGSYLIDVVGDNDVEPQDALQVINYLNSAVAPQDVVAPAVATSVATAVAVAAAPSAGASVILVGGSQVPQKADTVPGLLLTALTTSPALVATSLNDTLVAVSSAGSAGSAPRGTSSTTAVELSIRSLATSYNRLRSTVGQADAVDAAFSELVLERADA